MNVYIYNDCVTNKPPVAKYLERHYLKWINDQGEVRPQKEFADYLDVEYSRFNRYYNGKRSDMDYLTALKICEKTGDYELLDILNYPRPVQHQPVDDPFEGLPPDMSSAVKDALKVINSRLTSEGIEAGSEEAWRIATEELGKIGLKPKR